MTKVLVTEDYLGDIADAIRAKNGGSDTYTPGQMAGAIATLPDAPVLVAKTITANGEYDPEDDNADGYSGVIVAVPGSQPNLQSKTVNQNGTVLPDAGYDGLSSVVVNVSGGGGHEDDPPSYDISENYQEVEYIVCQGTQWVETPTYFGAVIVNTTYKYTGTDSNRCVIGYRAGSTNYCDWNIKETNVFWIRNNNCGLLGNSSNVGDGWRTVTCAIYTQKENRPIYIGNYYSSYSQSAGMPWIGYIRKVIIRNVNGYNNPVIGYFIPCYRKSDGVVGMYNVSNSTFYTPSGTGAFDKGPDVL